MKRSSGPRKTANLSESVHQQLNTYALAAGAAGVGALALAQPVAAKIVYTPAHVLIGLGGGLKSYNLDLNHDGVTDVTIHWRGALRECPTHGFHGTFSLYEAPASGNGVEGAPPAALYRGVPVGHSRAFYGSRGLMAGWQGGSCPPYGHGGNWYGVTDRYLGVKFRIHGKPTTDGRG
jgi:hypothetical protein